MAKESLGHWIHLVGFRGFRFVILEKVYMSKNRLGNSIFTAALDSPYYPPPGTCWDSSVQCNNLPVVDNPEFEGYNVDQIYQTLINYTEYRVRDQKMWHDYNFKNHFKNTM